MYTVVSQTTGKGDAAFDGGFPKAVGRGDRGFDKGTCVSATCISFVTVGYCVVIIVLAVAFKKLRKRDRSKQFDREIHPDDETVEEMNSSIFDNDRSVRSGSNMRRFA